MCALSRADRPGRLPELNSDRLPREVLLPRVQNLDTHRGLVEVDGDVLDNNLVGQPPCQRLADRKLHGCRENVVAGFEHEVEQAATELREVDPLAWRGEQDLNDPGSRR